MRVKTSTLKLYNQPVKLCNEKHNLPFVNQLSFPHFSVMELRVLFHHQSVALEQKGLFHLLRCTIPGAALPKWLQKVGTTGEGSRGWTHSLTSHSSLSTSHSPKVLIFWWTTAVFQHWQQKQEKKKFLLLQWQRKIQTLVQGR